MKFIKKDLLIIAAYCFFLVACMIPSNKLPKVEITNFDKFEHAVMGFGLSILGFLGIRQQFRTLKPLLIITCISLILPILFGGLIEILQLILPVNRTGSWFDFLFDSIGAFVGFFTCLCINYRHKKRRS